jgi:predicted nucleic acid-binding protein
VIIVVSDTSVLIDLERGRLLDACFRLPFEFVVPDLLYKRELAQYGGPALLEKGLRTQELTGPELSLAQDVRGHRARLSLPDAFAFALAVQRHWTLLTGDGELRELAEARSIPFHGVLWVLDQIFDGTIAEAGTLVSGLEAIAGHPRCRLPRTEVNARLVRYRTSRS